jgi:Domain of unknown function (DUF4386)
VKSYRGNAIAAGVMFILCSCAAILSIVPLGAQVEAPVNFDKLAGNDNGVVMTALIEFVWIATGMGIAIALYPVLQLFNPTLALGSVAGRMVENVFILIGTLCLLALLTVSQQAADSAAPSSFQATGDTLVAVRQWAPSFVAGVAFFAGTCMYNYVMYRSRLVPRWLSGWGLVGAVLSLAAVLYIGFAQDFGFSTVNNVLHAPIALQEMTLAVWLIVKGFNQSALRSIAPSTDTVSRDLSPAH